MAGASASASPKGKGQDSKEKDMTFFHPDLLEVPGDGQPPYLKGYRCLKCGQVDFPKVSPCPTCWGEEFEVVQLSRQGTLYSVTDIFIGQPGMATPYIFGYVDLPENVRIFAQMEGELGSFHCGDQVELVVGSIRTNADNLPVSSYKFKKAGA